MIDSDTATDRIGFGTTNLLTLVVFQTVITEEMPKTSDAVTALSKYVICLVVLSATGILESVIVETLINRTIDKPNQWLLWVLCRVPLLLRENPHERRKTMSKVYCRHGDLALRRASRRRSYRMALVPERRISSPRTSLTTVDSFEMPTIEKVENGNFSPEIDFEKAGKPKEKQPIGKKAPSDNCIHCLQNEQNLHSDLWAEVVYKIDTVALFFSLSISIGAPLLFFLPLIVIETTSDTCDLLGMR